MIEEKLDEYFELKDSIKTFRADLKDMIDQHELAESIEEMKKELKELQDKRNDDESIKQVSDKIKTMKERQDLLKEIVLAEMKESGQTKFEYNGQEILIMENLKFKRKQNAK